MTFPLLTPVTTPEFVTEAMAELLEVQIPPDVGYKVVVLFMQMEDGPVRMARGLDAMVKKADVSEVQPVVASVNLNVAFPVPMAVTRPELLIVAIVG